MTYSLEPFGEVGLDGPLLESLIEAHESSLVPALDRLWAYYRNPSSGRGRGASALAQASGLPARLRGRRDAGADDRADAKEVVIENDIAWRINAMVDFVFGKPVRFVSTAPDEGRRREIEAILDRVFESSGGGALLQDAGLLGAVHGHVDFAVRAEGLFDGLGGDGSFEAALEAVGEGVRVELVEATRGVPVLDPSDYRRMLAYLVVCDQETNELETVDGVTRRRVSRVVEVISDSHRQVYRDGELFEDAPNPLGFLPIVHVQDTSQPFAHEGISEVEPLIPVQDELNTRLSDRAHRVTMQSFKMYLAKGIEGFGATPIGPGQVWSTDNESAQVESFGGDMVAPSEDAHIGELREAMDKISSVSPVVIGVIRERLGQLSSENALRVTMTGILAKTERKRLAYGRALREVCRMVLAALDASGVYETDAGERGVEVRWQDPIPIDRESALRVAQRKVELGVPVDRVLAELGHGTTDTGVI